MLDADRPGSDRTGRSWTVRGAFRRVPRFVPVSVALASVLLFLASLMWAVLSPGFRAADELQHVNSVVRVAEGGGWPQPGEIRVRNEVVDALSLSGAVLGGPRTHLPGSSAIPPGSPRFADLTPTPVADRESFHALDDGSAPAGPIDQMTQHPPAYYVAAAVVYRAVDARDWRFDRAIFLLRALTALMVAVTVPTCCYVAARELTGRESVGKVAAFVPLLVPQFQFNNGAVTNDGATIAAASVVWALLLVITCSGPNRRRLLFLAVAVAAACWTKGTALSLLPAVPVAIAIAYRRSRGGTLWNWARPALGAAFGTLGLAFVLGGWWWALNLVRYGKLQPAAYEIPQGRMAPLSFVDFLDMFAWRVRWNFFAEVGILRSPELYPFAMSLAAVFAVLCTVGLLSRRGIGDRLVVLVGAGATLSVLIGTTYSAHVQSGNLPGIQGRYLFVLIVPIAVFFAMGLARLAGLVSIRAQWLVPGVALAGLGVTLLGLALGFQGYYVVPGRSWGEGIDRFFGWAAWSPTVIAGLLATFVLSGLLLAWVLGRQAHRAPTDDDRTPTAGAGAPEDVGSPSDRVPARVVSAPGSRSVLPSTERRGALV